MLDPIRNKFIEIFGQEEIIVSASGRANIIGEHTDYNEGWVFPFAIEQKIIFVCKKSHGHQIHALDVGESFTLENGVNYIGWQKLYAQLIQVLLAKNIKISGIQIAFGGDLPIGAGISSSSALCCGWLVAIDALYNLGLSRLEMVHLASEAEHGLGVRGGKMDQYAILFGEKDNALLLDCKTLTHTNYPIPKDWKWVLLHSGVTHDLVTTEYNARRSSCEKGLKIINDCSKSNYESLREVEYAETNVLKSNKDLYDKVTYILEENQRVKEFAKGISSENIEQCGAILYESHKGLSEKYEVSIPEIDTLVQYSRDLPNVYGSRLMGGGFGGCTINLVHDEYRRDINIIFKKFYARYGYQTMVIEVSPKTGIIFY
jgi:galactokinase